jgi:beta-lactam-binding protein with PASTA domain
VLLVLAFSLAACQQPRAPEVIGTLKIQGPNVTVNGTSATDGMAFHSGDVVATGPASRARLWLNTGGFIQLEENTDPGIVKTIREGLCWIIINIRVGMFGAQTGDCGQIAKGPHGNESIVLSQYVLAVSGQASVLSLLAGSAEVRNRRQVRVGEGQQVVMTRDFISDPRRMSGREIQLLVDWLGSFDFTGARPAIKPISVPRVIGQSAERARQSLEGASLALGQTAERPSARASPGTILDQKPEAGAMVPPGTAIYVEVAVTPPPPVRVPNLRHLLVPEAEKRLAQAKLQLGTVTERQSDSTRGTIIGQTPGAGEMAPPGSSVAVVVAQERRAEVPGILGLTVSQARQRLDQAGLRLGGVADRETGSAQPGTIVAQEPQPGTQLPPGASVNVTVATAPTMARVPPLFGASLGQADQRLSDAGLRRGQVSEQLSESHAQGTVIGQDPGPDSTVPPNSFVNLTLAVAARRVPNLIGSTLQSARSRLSSTNLSLGAVSEEITQSYNAGTVMRQSPQAGTLVRVGTAVRVTIAKQMPVFQTPQQPVVPLPQPVKMCTAPPIDGLPYEKAKRILAERGLQGRVRGSYGYNSNTVYRQDPKAGAQFPCSQAITFDLGTIG